METSMSRLCATTDGLRQVPLTPIRSKACRLYAGNDDALIVLDNKVGWR